MLTPAQPSEGRGSRGPPPSTRLPASGQHPSRPGRRLLLCVEGCAASSRAWSKQMEAVSLAVYVLGPLLLPLLAVLLMALCVRCRELPGEWVPVG